MEEEGEERKRSRLEMHEKSKPEQFRSLAR